jgi:hypothetical protein
MMKLIGALLTAGGAAFWLLKRHQSQKPVPHKRSIVLGPGNTAGCRVARCPEDVTMKRGRNDTLTWQISNESTSGSTCDRQVQVCIGDWKLNGEPVPPPVKAQGAGALCRMIPPRQRPIPLQVVIDPQAKDGKYRYGILIDNVLADDPMLEIIE